MTTACPAGPVEFRHNRFLHVLCVLFLVVWTASAIHPVMVADWWMENMLVIIFLAVLLATHRSLPLSNRSYALIFFFLCVHEWGAHHRYADVPLGEWLKPLLHTARNHYDRVAHFAFGLLLTYPWSEVLRSKGALSRTWAAGLAVILTLGCGAGYEILEGAAASVVSTDLGNAFLSLQGDPWDTHKDMFMEFAGATIAMSLLVLWTRRKAEHTLSLP